MPTLYDLKKTEACAVKKAMAYDFEKERGDNQKKAGIAITETLNIAIDGAPLAGLEDRLGDAYEAAGIYTDSAKQRNLQIKDAAKYITRYVTSEKRKLYRAKAMDVDLGQGLIINEMRPHAVVYGKDVTGYAVIEVIRFFYGKPTMAQSSADSSLELYALLRYGRMLLAPGEPAQIIASHYYLRKTNDSNGKRPHFDTDFFDIKGGRNIVHLSELYNPATGKVSELDARFEPIVKLYLTGVPEESCSAKDCEMCEIAPICHFADPPLSTEEEKPERKISALRLTPEQKKIKEFHKGVMRVIAGAGTGKTMSVVMHILYLLNNGVKPEEILVFSFTVAAVLESLERILRYAEDDGIADEVDMSKLRDVTFNGFGQSVLQEDGVAKMLGIKEGLRLIDDIDRAKIVSSMISPLDIDGLDYRNLDANEYNVKGAIAVAAKAFETFKKYPTLGLSDIDELYDKFDDYHPFCTKEAFEKLYRLYRDYDSRLREEGLIEFQDQENLVFELLDLDPYYLEKYGIRHIIVDEFQDTSMKQIELLRRFKNCPSFESLMVVGDDDQAIYSKMRDTTPANMINLDKILGVNVEDVKLVDNFRCTPEIIEFANTIIAPNTMRVIKELKPTRPHGDPVTVLGFLTKDEEQEWIASEIKRLIDGGENPGHIVILARTKSELLKMADRLAKLDIPSVIQFPEKLLDDSRVLAAISMIKAIKNTCNKTDLLIYANALAGGDLKHADAKTIADACGEADKRITAYKAIAEDDKKKEVLKDMLSELDPDGKNSIYAEFVNGLLLRPTTDKIIEYAEDFIRFGKNQAARRTGVLSDGVILSTAHSSKGLEWPIVFNMIGGYDKENLHGHLSAKGVELLEEERRLLFVSSTRARDKLYVTAQYTSGGKLGNYIYNQFLIECYHAVGKEFSTEKIEAERLRVKKEKAAEKKKQQLQEKMAELGEESSIA